ncbi:winged helix DNA-binding domain-containing protein [Virgisporangium aurantiacum]|uniref:Winged helix DNA-binding domain-containing protein n=1 Tax=Virgisporangium aurantiacum TaxID=175570 RepID=A0A8J3Z1I0_9ACTN|nr:winged helix DNA-binding domain-containing protein [Virgisporangium aurantiacum]GIJ54558.1 hypothetical protein Vau01_020740 [Virgisporangium aurantiacum]
MTSGAALTAGQLNRATLARQLLLNREPVPVGAAVRRVVALQAQEPASPYLALWNRVTDFAAADLDAAFAGAEVVKATLMRITLHAVHVADYPVFHNALLRVLRGPRLGHARFTDSGLSISDADELAVHLLAFAAAGARTKADIEAMFEERLGHRHRGVWWALRCFAPLVQVPTGGPWSFGTRPVFRTYADPLPVAHGEDSTRRLVRRYLDGFGPASIADIAQFTLLTRTAARDAVRALGDDLVVRTGPDGADLYDVPGAPLPPARTPAPPRLLPMWDSTLLAYADRGRMIPPEYRTLVTRINGDVLPTLLVDGHVAGVWRPLGNGIEATAFRPLSARAWKGLATEAAALVEFLADRDPSVYRRYGHWWAKLPPGSEVRTLG